MYERLTQTSSPGLIVPRLCRIAPSMVTLRPALAAKLADPPPQVASCEICPFGSVSGVQPDNSVDRRGRDRHERQDGGGQEQGPGPALGTHHRPSTVAESESVPCTPWQVVHFMRPPLRS